MYEFKLPDLGEGIHEGEILKWHVAVGEEVVEDEPLVDVETDKAAVTIPSPVGGKITALLGDVGDTVLVGHVLAVIGGELEQSAPAPGAAASAVTPSAATPTAEPPDTRAGNGKPAGAVARPTAVHPPGRPVPAAPATRRLARELGVDLYAVTATGPAGRVTAEDVTRFAEAGQPPPAAEPSAAPAPTTALVPTEPPRAETAYAAHAASAIPFLDIEPLPDFSQWGPVTKEPLRSIRRRVAHRMVTSMTLIPHVAHQDEADVTELERFRKEERERRQGQPGGHLTLLSFVAKAVTAGLRAAPAFNASLDPFDEVIIYKDYYNIGIAVDTGRGLIVPVVRNTDRKSIIEMSRDIEDLAQRAREGSLGVDDLRGGTFTITNVGPMGGTALIPAINYPEVAILGMGKVQDKPVVRDGQIVIRTVLPLTLAFDHRIADGADAARFVSELVRQLSDPRLLLLET